jgi:hypothetical protein
MVYCNYQDGIDEPANRLLSYKRYVKFLVLGTEGRWLFPIFLFSLNPPRSRTSDCNNVLTTFEKPIEHIQYFHMLFTYPGKAVSQEARPSREHGSRGGLRARALCLWHGTGPQQQVIRKCPGLRSSQKARFRFPSITSRSFHLPASTLEAKPQIRLYLETAYLVAKM